MNGSIIKRKSSCPAHNSKWHNCQIAGHFTTSKDMKTSKSQKGIKKIEQSDKESQLNIDKYTILIVLELPYRIEQISTMVISKFNL